MPEFRVLGPFEVVSGATGGTVVRLGGPKQRAVLALLVLRANQVVPTHAILDAVWGEAAPASAAAIVRTCVSRLRQALAIAGRAPGEVTVASRPRGYLLEVQPDRVDAHRFRHLVARGRDAAAAGQLCTAVDRLRRALGLWRGDVLADLDGLEALRPEIAQLEELRLSATGDLFDAELASGHHAGIVGELEVLTRQHPFQERLWAQLMLALYRSGRQADALAAYQRVRAALVDQLGIEPGPALQALERDVLDQAPALDWDPPAGLDGRGPGKVGPISTPIPLPPALLATVHGRRFVGRVGERTMLTESLGAARAGLFGTVLMAGPPGIGKTALAGWLAWEAHVAGATVVLGRADEGADVPFQPLGEAIRHWTAHVPPAVLDRLSEADATQLTRIAPLLGERRGVGSSQALTEPDSPTDRFRSFDAIGRWIEALAGSGPAVVVLEDLHWADPATLRAVHHLRRHPPAAGVLLLVTYRDTELDVSPELTDLLAGARGDLGVRRIDLGGLRGHEVVDLLRTCAGADVGAAGGAFAARLAGLTGGCPLFVDEVLRHLIERGAIAPQADRWVDHQPLESFGVPPAVTEVIERRLRRLPACTATVLRSAAVLGERFDLPVLSQIVDMPEITVVEALEPTLVAGLITYDGLRADRFAFTCALVHQAILDGLPLSQRARIHWRAGEALASLSASQPEP